MFGLSEFYDRILKKRLPAKCGIACEEVDSGMAKVNRLLTESVSCFSYTLVLSGSALVNYDDKIVELMKNDILIYTPGMMIKTLEASDDFSALCLMGDESVTYEIPYARNVISASYFPSAALMENKLTLTDCEAVWLQNRMKEILLYLSSRHTYKTECLYSLYSLFILDLMNVEKQSGIESVFKGSTVDLFIKFVKLAAEKFAEHHDIFFYADSLAVTTIYLSRIVKRFTGRTVKNYIDGLLVREAAYLLLSTDLPISEIAEKLNFATPASFCKFFKKQKNVSPREYRASGPEAM